MRSTGCLVALALIVPACGGDDGPSGPPDVYFDLGADTNTADTFWAMPFPSDLRLTSDGNLDFTVDVNHYPVEHAPIYLDNGNGVYQQVPFAAAAQLFAIVDPNGDGHPDIFSTMAGGGGGPEQHFVQLEIVAPAAPLGLHAVGHRNGIHLTWNSVTGATSYQVWRSARHKQRRLIGTSGLPRYNDRRARRRITYRYTVQAQNAAGISRPSSAVRARRP